MCVCKLRREGATGIGSPAEKLEPCCAIAGGTQASISRRALSGVAPGSLTETGHYIPGTVLEAEGEVRVKGKEQCMWKVPAPGSGMDLVQLGRAGRLKH